MKHLDLVGVAAVRLILAIDQAQREGVDPVWSAKQVQEARDKLAYELREQLEGPLPSTV